MFVVFKSPRIPANRGERFCAPPGAALPPDSFPPVCHISDVLSKDPVFDPTAFFFRFMHYWGIIYTLSICCCCFFVVPRPPRTAQGWHRPVPTRGAARADQGVAPGAKGTGPWESGGEGPRAVGPNTPLFVSFNLHFQQKSTPMRCWL